jgi:hypothetical protein
VAGNNGSSGTYNLKGGSLSAAFISLFAGGTLNVDAGASLAYSGALTIYSGGTLKNSATLN